MNAAKNNAARGSAGPAAATAPLQAAPSAQPQSAHAQSSDLRPRLGRQRAEDRPGRRLCGDDPRHRPAAAAVGRLHLHSARQSERHGVGRSGRPRDAVVAPAAAVRPGRPDRLFQRLPADPALSAQDFPHPDPWRSVPAGQCAPPAPDRPDPGRRHRRRLDRAGPGRRASGARRDGAAGDQRPAHPRLLGPGRLRPGRGVPRGRAPSSRIRTDDLTGTG
uniref:Translation initiation factor IF-2 n=1 Tax=Parastrongyloides trichosuri TaxID=131310 RepID=A0A0N4ZIZ0_PARTI